VVRNDEVSVCAQFLRVVEAIAGVGRVLKPGWQIHILRRRAFA